MLVSWTKFLESSPLDFSLSLSTHKKIDKVAYFLAEKFSKKLKLEENLLNWISEFVYLQRIFLIISIKIQNIFLKNDTNEHINELFHFFTLYFFFFFWHVSLLRNHVGKKSKNEKKRKIYFV